MNIFTETEADFFQYLIKYGEINSYSRSNYMSWLNFLSKEYQIDNNLTNETITDVIAQENSKRLFRNIYKNENDISNFKSALKKYLSFLSSDFKTVTEEMIKSEVAVIEKKPSCQQQKRKQ